MATSKLTIELGGTEVAIRNLQQLETAIRGAREAIKLISFGEEYDKFEKDIQKAETKYKELVQSIKANPIDREVGKFLNFGSAVVSAFAAAQTALTLFGKESEDVAKAAAQAQQLLTLAYAAGELAKQKDTIATIGNTTAKIANTLITQGLTAASRALFAVIAANPLGAFLTILTAVIGAMVLFKDDTDDAAAAQEDLNRKVSEFNTLAEREILLLEKNGATSIELAEARLQKAKDLEQFAQFAYFNLGKTEEQKKAWDEATNNRIQAEIALQKEQSNAKEKQDQAELDRLKKIAEERERLERERQEQLLKTAQLTTELLKSANQDIQNPFPESAQLKRLEEYVSLLDRYSKILESPSLEDVSTQITLEGILAPNDVLTQVVTDFRKRLTEAAKGFGDDIKQVRDDLLDEAGKLVQAGFLSPEAFKALEDYAQAYQTLGEKGIDVAQFISKKSQESFFELTKAIKINSGEISKELDSQGKIVAAQTEMSFSDASAAYEKLLKGFEDDFTAYLIQNDKNIKAITDPAKQEQEARSRAKARVDIIVNQTDQIIEEEQRIILFIDKQQTLLLDKQKKYNKAILGFVSENIDGLIAEYNNLYDFDTQEAEVAFDNKIRALIDFTTLTEEELTQLAKLYQMFYEKLNQQREENSAGEKTKLQEFVENSLNAIQEFQVALNAIGQSFSDFYNFKLEELEKRNRRILDDIVGDSKKANDDRIAQERIYNEEKKKLEKQSALASLRISLAQSLANTAEAVGKALTAGPIAGQIAAVIVAAAGAAQTGIILAQINNIDTYKLGGRIKKGQGGMVVGNSHEYGGVKFQNGGIELEGGEAVINRLSTLQYADLLSSINMSGGGKPIIQNNFDDSRIVEAIAKQRATPIRAYVVESDITEKQQVQRRLELLSQI